jgi:hypothetical protein
VMKPIRIIVLQAAISAGIAFLASPAWAGPTTYNFFTLDNNTDPTFNQLLGINNAGTIAGYYGVGSVTHPNKGYTLVPPYGQGQYTNENFPGSAQTQVVGINSNASPTTVGFWVDAMGNNFGFVDQGNSFTSIADPSTPTTGTMVNQLLGVNNNNVAAGFYVDAAGNAQGYLYNIGTMAFTPIILPLSFNAMMTTATSVNNAGEVTGFYTDTAGNIHGFLDNGGTFTSFDDPSGNGTNTMFLGLNNNGMVSGSYVDSAGVTHGLVYNILLNTFQTVDDPHSSATPAFGVTGTTVNGLNDKGQLVGFFSDGTNVNGFLATPVPEPGTLAMMALAGILASLRRKLRA